MPKYINLEDAKQHLRVDFADDDAYIMSLISMAEMAVQMELGDPPNPKEDEEEEPIIGLRALEDEDGQIPAPVRHGILIVLAHYYSFREPVLAGVSVVKIPFSLDWLLSSYKNRTIQ